MPKQQQDITAIIYDKKGRVLSIGKNSYTKTHPMQARYAKLAGPSYTAHNYAYKHAEIDAIIRCEELDKAYRIEVIRVRKDGSFGSACPCEACKIAISRTNIKIIVHT